MSKGLTSKILSRYNLVVKTLHGTYSSNVPAVHWKEENVEGSSSHFCTDRLMTCYFLQIHRRKRSRNGPAKVSSIWSDVESTEATEDDISETQKRKGKNFDGENWKTDRNNTTGDTAVTPLSGMGGTVLTPPSTTAATTSTPQDTLTHVLGIASMASTASILWEVF